MRKSQLLIGTVMLILPMIESLGVSAPLPPRELKERAILNMSGPIAFSPDGKTLVLCGWDKVIRLWDVASAKEGAAFPGHQTGADSVVFSPDSKLLATSGRDLSIKLWDVAEKKEIASLPMDHGSTDRLAFGENGKVLAAANGELVEVWDLERKKVRSSHKLGGQGSRCVALVFTPEGKLLAACTQLRTPFVVVWDVLGGKVIATPEKDASTAYAIAFSRDCKVLSSVTPERGLRLWDIASGTNTATLTFDDQITSVAFHPDGKLLAVGHTKDVVRRTAGKVRLIDLTTNKEVADFQASPGPVIGMAFGPDGSILAAPSRVQINVWDIPVNIRP